MSTELKKLHKWLSNGLKKSLVGLNSGDDTHKKAAAGGCRTAYYNTISYLETHFADELELEKEKISDTENKSLEIKSYEL